MGLTPSEPAVTSEWFVTSRGVNGGGDGMWQKMQNKDQGVATTGGVGRRLHIKSCLSFRDDWILLCVLS